MEKNLLQTLKRVQRQGPDLKFSLQLTNRLRMVVLYEAVKVYERYGLRPTLNTYSCMKHWPVMGDVYKNAVSTANGTNKANDWKAKLKSYLDGYQSVGNEFRNIGRSTINFVHNCDDVIRYLLIMFNAKMAQMSKDELIHMKAGTFVGFTRTEVEFENPGDPEDPGSYGARTSDFLPTQGDSGGPNNISFVEFAGSFLDCKYTKTLETADQEHIKFINDTIGAGEWKFEDLGAMDDERVTTKNPSTPTSGTNAIGKTDRTIAEIYGPVGSEEEEEEDAGGDGTFSMTEEDQDIEPKDTAQAESHTEQPKVSEEKEEDSEWTEVTSKRTRPDEREVIRVPSVTEKGKWTEVTFMGTFDRKAIWRCADGNERSVPWSMMQWQRRQSGEKPAATAPAANDNIAASAPFAFSMAALTSFRSPAPATDLDAILKDKLQQAVQEIFLPENYKKERVQAAITALNGANDTAHLTHVTNQVMMTQFAKAPNMSYLAGLNKAYGTDPMNDGNTTVDKTTVKNVFERSHYPSLHWKDEMTDAHEQALPKENTTKEMMAGTMRNKWILMTLTGKKLIKGMTSLYKDVSGEGNHTKEAKHLKNFFDTIMPHAGWAVIDHTFTTSQPRTEHVILFEETTPAHSDDEKASSKDIQDLATANEGNMKTDETPDGDGDESEDDGDETSSLHDASTKKRKREDGKDAHGAEQVAKTSKVDSSIEEPEEADNDPEV